MVKVDFAGKQVYIDASGYKKDDLWNQRYISETLMARNLSVTDLFSEENAYFLYNYAAKLNYFGYYERSCFLVDKCRNYFNDYDVQMLIADNLFHLEEWNKAKNHYSKAFYMCPNRFVPLNQLHKIAILENDSNMARKIACLIIDKPTKVPSATVYKIKQKMQQYLETDINCIVK